MSDANFIPLGDASEKHAFDRPSSDVVKPLQRPGKIIGKDKKERKEIARRIRLAHKKEKKKIKADAKRQRKENAIMHRRMTKNTEKYTKNKERNRLRAIDAERNKIRTEAVHQVEKLAAKHDPSGKMFNVGAVIVTEDGRVRSKDSWEKAEAARKAKAAGIELPQNVNEERLPQILNSRGEPKKLSNNQRKRLALLNPGPVPPKPVIPEGLEGEIEGPENFVALWDITDQDIEVRIKRGKNAKKNAAKHLRKQQKEQKKFNRAMKIKKKQAANMGVIFDPVQAKREILGEDEEDKKESNVKDEDTSTSGSDSDSDAESDSDEGNEKQAKKEKVKEAKDDDTSTSGSDDSSESDSDSGSDSDDGGAKASEAPSSSAKQGKRKAAEPADDEPAAKKSKPDEPADQPKQKKKPGFNRPKLNMNLITAEGIAARVKKEQHRVKLNEKRKAKLAANIAAGHEPTLIAVGLLKRNRNRMPDETPEERAERKRKRAEKKARIAEKRADPVEQERRARLREGYKKKKEEKKAERREQRRLDKIEKDRKKKRKSGMTDWEKKRIAQRGPGAAVGAPRNGEQWNPSALSGGADRQDKFRRLLGAGKSNGNGEVMANGGGSEHGSGEVDLGKVQSELERQFDAGVKMKHEGGGKKRGLGA